MVTRFPHLRRRSLFAAGALLGAAIPAAASPRSIIRRAPLIDEIGPREVAFLAYDLAGDAEHVLEGSDLATRRAPWSSFKIPNLLLALETGVASGLDASRRWDPARRPPAQYWPAEWRRDQTLRSAFERSAAWYFQDVALEIGAARYRDALARWRYGNAEVGSDSDDFWQGSSRDFWNGGSLRISVMEQVAFLASLLGGRLGVAPGSIEALTSASHAGDADGMTLHGKTGSGPVTPGDLRGAFEGWYCGFVLRPAAPPAVFALYARAPGFRALAAFRRAFSLRLLAKAGILPDTAG